MWHAAAIGRLLRSRFGRRAYLQARRNAENLSETVPGSARGMQQAAGVAGASGRATWVLDQRLSQAGEEVGGSGPAVRAGGWGRWLKLPGGDVPGLTEPPTYGTGIGGQGAVSCPRVGPRTKTGSEAAGRCRPGSGRARRSKTELALEMAWGGRTGAGPPEGSCDGSRLDDAFGMSP